MNLSQDFRDLLAAFAAARARYLLIGGYAVSIHSKPRYTKDIDLWVDADPKNIEQVAVALTTFGAPVRAIEDVISSGANEIVWFGAPPSRIDILKEIPGIDFGSAYVRRAVVAFDDLTISVISVEDLIVAKRAAGRPQDLLDVQTLCEHQK